MKKALTIFAAGILCLAAAAWAQDTPNLALGKNVRVSSNYDQPGWGPEFVVDGVRTERAGARGWSSQGDTSVNHTEWIQVDLGTNYQIDRVDLYPRNAAMREGESFPIDFTIQVSLDANNWRTVVSRTGYPKPGTEAQKFTFDPTVDRYVKITGTNLRYLGAESAYFMQFAEIEVYGPPKGEQKKIEQPKPPVVAGLVPSNWSGEITMPNGATQTLVIRIEADNQISGQSIQTRTGGPAIRHVITGSYDPGTRALTMKYSTKSGASVTEGDLSGKIDTDTTASGTITISVSLTQVRTKAQSSHGTWKMTRQ